MMGGTWGKWVLTSWRVVAAGAGRLPRGGRRSGLPRSLVGTWNDAGPVFCHIPWLHPILVRVYGTDAASFLSRAITVSAVSRLKRCLLSAV